MDGYGDGLGSLDELARDDLLQGSGQIRRPSTIPPDYKLDEAHNPEEYDDAMYHYITTGEFNKWNDIIKKNETLKIYQKDKDGKVLTRKNGTPIGIGISDMNAARWLKHNKDLVRGNIGHLGGHIDRFISMIVHTIRDDQKAGKNTEKDYKDIKDILKTKLRSMGGRRRKTNKVRKSKVRVFRRRSSKSKKSRKSRK